jgi:hypothetical protein
MSLSDDQMNVLLGEYGSYAEMKSKLKELVKYCDNQMDKIKKKLDNEL